MNLIQGGVCIFASNLHRRPTRAEVRRPPMQGVPVVRQKLKKKKERQVRYLGKYSSFYRLFEGGQEIGREKNKQEWQGFFNLICPVSSSCCHCTKWQVVMIIVSLWFNDYGVRSLNSGCEAWVVGVWRRRTCPFLPFLLTFLPAVTSYHRSSFCLELIN